MDIWSWVTGTASSILGTIIMMLWGKYGSDWKLPDIVFRGLLTFTALVFLFNQFGPKPAPQTTIHQWLENAGLSIQIDPTKIDQIFLFYVTDRQGNAITLYQGTYKGAPIVIGSGLDFTKGDKSRPLSEKDQIEIMDATQMALLSLGVEYSFDASPPKQATLKHSFIFDHTMTEREFMSKVYLLSRAVTVAQKIVHQKVAQLQP